MFKRVAHIAIAVKNLETSKELFSRLLGVPVQHEELVGTQRVRTAMFRIGETSLELLEGTDPNSAITKFVEKEGEGIHHISFDVDDVNREITRLRKSGFQLVDDTARPGAEETMVAFLHPHSTNAVLIEISEKKKKEGKH